MKYGTLNEGVPVMAPNPLHVEGYLIYNPTDEKYAAAGYLPIIETPYPTASEGEEAKYYTASWKEQDGQIVRLWTETEPPVPAPVKPTLEERVGAVEASTAALSADLELLLSGATEEPEEVAANEV